MWCDMNCMRVPKFANSSDDGSSMIGEGQRFEMNAEIITVCAELSIRNTFKSMVHRGSLVLAISFPLAQPVCLRAWWCRGGVRRSRFIGHTRLSPLFPALAKKTEPGRIGHSLRPSQT